MKFTKITALCAVALAFLVWGCTPDSVQPTPSNGDVAALLIDDGGGDPGNSDTAIHIAPDPKCGPDVNVPLINTQFGPSYPLGNVQLVNGPEKMFIQAKPSPGLVLSGGALNVGAWGSTPPVDANGSTDPSQFTMYNAYNPVRQIQTWLIPIVDIEQKQTYSIWAEVAILDPNGNPQFTWPAWAYGKPVTGGFTIDYQMQICPFQSCEIWQNANNPCAPPCAVPTAGLGDDLSDYACGNPKANKVTVCHLPPGNPANMQEICISVNALPAHIIDFKPANNPCMGHHSGCHLGPCDPCGPGTTADHASNMSSNCPGK